MTLFRLLTPDLPRSELIIAAATLFLRHLLRWELVAPAMTSRQLPPSAFFCQPTCFRYFWELPDLLT